jgi:nitrate reductase NapD
MPEAQRCHHISSAVVSVMPAMADNVLACLSAMQDVEVHGHEGSKIVVVIEGSSTGAMGDHLTRIALLDGVIAANMVFEHIEAEEATG